MFQHVPTFPGSSVTKPRVCWTVCWTLAASDRVSDIPSGSVGRVAHTRSSGNSFTITQTRLRVVSQRDSFGLGSQVDNSYRGVG
eukprot:255405-Prymnesium_polylepis.1